MSILHSLFGPSQELIWGQLSQEIGGSMTGGGWTGCKVQAQTGDWIVTLDTYTQSNGKSSTTYTRIRAPFVNRDGFRFTVYRAGLFTEIGKFFGMQDIEIGDPFFDQTFVVQGNQEAKIRALCGNARISALLHAQPAIYLSIRHEESWLWGPKYPETVDVLYFQVVGIIRDVQVLKALFELYAEVLNHLCHMDGGYQEDVGQHIRDLTAPGGRVVSENLVLWDGDPARRVAAQALGRLRARVAIPYLVEALRDPDPLLRGNAAWALGEIGERAAAAPMLSLLADDDGAGNAPVKGFAAAALQQCGLGELVTAFAGTLNGDRGSLETLRQAARPELIPAFQQALASSAPDRAANSAWALGELGAIQAMRPIRERLRSLPRTAYPAQAERMEQAIRMLERHSELPRPAETPGLEGGALPLPSAPTEPPAS